MEDESVNLLFAVDQQQYLQGYIPVVLITLEVTTQNLLLPRPMEDSVDLEAALTGPG